MWDFHVAWVSESQNYSKSASNGNLKVHSSTMSTERQETGHKQDWTFHSREEVDGDETPGSDALLDNSDDNHNDCPMPPRRSALALMDDVRDGKKKYLKICAPMVRYSKLPFRELVRQYDVDLAYTPMILADVYKHSKISRDHEFRSNKRDEPVVIQFAAHSAHDLADAAQLAAPYVNGVDLNCGCPQKWAIKEKIGSHLMSDPELVRDMVRQVKARTSGVQLADGNHLPFTIKIRIHPDLKETVEFVRRAESVGVDWITVHGRTRKQKSSDPVDLDAIKLVKEHATVPIFANGDVFTLEDADRIVEYTKTDGVMAARGLLENPALFAGHKFTPVDAVEKYIKLAMGYGSTHFIFHHHLMFMMDRSMSKAQKKTFNCLTSVAGVLDYMDEHYG